MVVVVVSSIFIRSVDRRSSWDPHNATDNRQTTREGIVKRIAMRTWSGVAPDRQQRTRRSAKSGDRVIPKRLMSFSYPSPRTLQEITTCRCSRWGSTSIKTMGNPPRKSRYLCVWDYDWEAIWYALWATSESPYFVLPVKRDDGQFALLSQAQEKHVLFTYLEDYKITRKPPCLTWQSLCMTISKVVKTLWLARDISDMMTKGVDKHTALVYQILLFGLRVGEHIQQPTSLILRSI